MRMQWKRDTLLCVVLSALLLPVCAFWSLLLALWARARFYVP